MQDYIEDLGWNRLGLQSSEMNAVAGGDRDLWRLNLELLPANLTVVTDSGFRRNKNKKYSTS